MGKVASILLYSLTPVFFSSSRTYLHSPKHIFFSLTPLPSSSPRPYTLPKCIYLLTLLYTHLLIFFLPAHTLPKHTFLFFLTRNSSSPRPHSLPTQNTHSYSSPHPYPLLPAHTLSTNTFYSPSCPPLPQHTSSPPSHPPLPPTHACSSHFSFLTPPPLPAHPHSATAIQHPFHHVFTVLNDSSTSAKKKGAKNVRLCPGDFLHHHHDDGVQARSRKVCGDQRRGDLSTSAEAVGKAGVLHCGGNTNDTAGRRYNTHNPVGVTLLHRPPPRHM